MKKVLFFLVVLLVFLHSKNTLVQDGRLFHQSVIAQQVSIPVQANTQSDAFDLDDNVIDITDDNLNDSEKKNFSFQKVAFSTIHLVVRPISDHFFASKWFTQKNIAFQTPLFILNRVFRI